MYLIFCLSYCWAGHTTSVPYNSSTTPDVSDIVVTKHLLTTVYVTACSVLSSDHILELIDTRYRISFLNLLDRPDYRRTDRSKFQGLLEDEILSKPDLTDEVTIDTCVGVCPSPFKLPWKSLVLKVRRVLPVASNAGCYSGSNLPEEPAEESVVDYQGTCFES